MNNSLIPSDQEFPLSFNSYAAFDALSLKQLMKQRLAENGTFTDQVFEGSNFNNLLDVIAYSYNVLLYYLNQTSNESLFSSAQLYENMNKIVKLINYNPVGPQTGLLNYEVTANTGLPPGVYTIPRFSYFTINDIYYSFNSDLTFVKSSTGIEVINELSNFSFLYQGKFHEYPVYVSIGENYEEFSIVLVDDQENNQLIDNNNFFVFVRDKSGYWKEWNRVDNIYLSDGSSEVFEVRLNENQRYSIKFGNNVTGKKLEGGDIVAVYFLKTDGSLGEVGPNTLLDNNLFFFNTTQYDQIMNDIRSSDIKILTFDQTAFLRFNNENSSIPFSNLEDTNKIRENAPNYFKQKGRLVTTEDISTYIKTNFENVISDVVVVNNWDYLDKHVKYLYNLGLKQPMLDSRVLINQVMFADSCNFNNVYIYCVPKMLYTNSFTQKRGYLTPGVKETIISKINKLKTCTTEIVFQDPVYYGIGFGAASQREVFNKELTVDILKESKLQIIKSDNSLLNDSQIKNKIISILLDYFDFKNTKLGQLINIQKITQDILNVEGVENISTVRGENVSPGLTLLGFNTVYNDPKEDISILNQNLKLEYFQIPFWFDSSIINNQIEIVTIDSMQSNNREY